MYDYITPQKLLDALSFLKANNPLYADIDVNREWLESAMANDAELCECLVEQPNTDTVEPVVNPSTDITTDSDNVEPQSPVANVAPSSDDVIQSVVDMQANVESPPDVAMHCSDYHDPLLLAMHKLETIARQNGFTVHDVPADGDCIFSAFVYGLNSIGIRDVNSQTLRLTVADYMRANKASYSDFVCQLVEQTDGYNADTAAPTKEDVYIASTADPEMQIDFR